MAAYGRVTLNRGGRNSRFDCSSELTKPCIILELTKICQLALYHSRINQDMSTSLV